MNKCPKNKIKKIVRSGKKGVLGAGWAKKIGVDDLVSKLLIERRQKTVRKYYLESRSSRPQTEDQMAAAAVTMGIRLAFAAVFMTGIGPGEQNRYQNGTYQYFCHQAGPVKNFHSQIYNLRIETCQCLRRNLSFKKGGFLISEGS
jgi:hypothetical protein